MNSKHSFRAHSGVLVNRTREGLLKVLNESHLKLRNHNIISINMSVNASCASPEQVADQFRQGLQKYMGTHQQVSPLKETPQSLFPFLEPFNIGLWKKQLVTKQLNNLKLPLDIGYINIYICHHYTILNSLHVNELYEDMRDFAALMRKINLFGIIRDIEGINNRVVRDKCRQLVRVLKWRTEES